jgi:hypothetical protein
MAPRTYSQAQNTARRIAHTATEPGVCALCGGPINEGSPVSRKAGLVMHAEHSRAAKQLTVLRHLEATSI